MLRFKSFITENKSKSTETVPGFHKDEDGNVFISHSTSYHKRDRKKDKKKDTNESTIISKVKKSLGIKADHEKTLDEHAAGHNKKDHSAYLSAHSAGAHEDPHEKKAFQYFKANSLDMNEHLIDAHKKKLWRGHGYQTWHAQDHAAGEEKHVHMNDFSTFPTYHQLEHINRSESHVHHTIIKHSKPFGKKMTLYHGSHHDFGEAAKTAKDGIVHNPSHMSTSHDHKSALDFGSGHMVVIHADKKTKGVHIDGKGSGSEGHSEKETIIPAGTKFKHIKSHKTSDGYDVHHFKVHSQQNANGYPLDYPIGEDYRKEYQDA